MQEPLSFSFHSSIERWFRLPAEPLEIVGTTSFFALASLVNHHYSELKSPHLVIFPRTEDVRRWVRAGQLLDPRFSALELPAFDVGLYSNLYPSRRHIAGRVRWLHQAQQARPGQIFVASIE